MAMSARLCWCFKVVFFTAFVSCATGDLEVVYNDQVQGTSRKSVTLMCNVTTDLDIKEIIWKRADTNQIVYYFEPPKFNRTSNIYKGRAYLSPSDGSSLVLTGLTVADEGWYECHVKVWKAPNPNDTFGIISILPEERNVQMELIVNVPPSSVKMTSLISRKNLTLTCVAQNAKPSVDIKWLKTDKNGNEVEFTSSKIVTDYTSAALTTTQAHRYFNLAFTDDGSQFSCIVDQPETDTNIVKTVITNAPVVLNAYDREFDKIPGGSVQYSEYRLQPPPSEDMTTVGLVKIRVSPNTIVKINESVTMVASTQNTFPTPSYSWWTDDTNVQANPAYVTGPLTEADITYYCLVENAVGRAVLGVTLYATETGYIPEESEVVVSNSTAVYNEPVSQGMAGFAIAAIVIGSIVGFLFIALAVWYCTCRNPPNEENNYNPSNPASAAGNDSSPRNNARPKRSNSKTISTQTLDRDVEAGKDESVPLKRSSRKKKSKKSKKKSTTAIAKHLNDFDENASYLDEYGSKFGINENDSDGEKEEAPPGFEPPTPRSRTTTGGEQDYLSANSGGSDNEEDTKNAKVYKVNHTTSEEDV